MKSCPQLPGKSISDRCSHTAFTYLNKQCEVAWRCTHPLKHNDNLEIPLICGLRPGHRKCFPHSVCQELTLFTPFFLPNEILPAHWLPWSCVTAPGAPRSLPREAQKMWGPGTWGQRNQDRCHYRLPSPVGAKTICTGGSPTKLETFSGWGSEALKELGTALHHTCTKKKEKINHVEAKEDWGSVL